MKYQKAVAEMIRFDEFVEFMAASGSYQDQLNDYVKAHCTKNFEASTDGGNTFRCKNYNGGANITINGHTYVYESYDGNSGKWRCSTFN